MKIERCAAFTSRLWSALGSKWIDPAARTHASKVCNNWRVDCGSRIEDRGSRIEDRGSRIEDRGSRIEDRGSRIEDRGSRIEDRGSKMEDRVGGFILNLRSSILYPLSSILLPKPAEFDLLIDHEPEHDHSGDEDYSAQRQRHREGAGEMRDEAGHHGRERRAHIAAEILNAGDRSDDFFRTDGLRQRPRVGRCDAEAA